MFFFKFAYHYLAWADTAYFTCLINFINDLQTQAAIDCESCKFGFWHAGAALNLIARAYNRFYLATNIAYVARELSMIHPVMMQKFMLFALCAF